MESGQKAKFVRAEDFYRAIRCSFNQDSEDDEDSIMAEFKSSPLLIIDDLGSGSLSDAERRYTLEVIDQRIIRRRPTVVTTNWNIQQIGEKFDERISSRLGTFKRLNFTNRDRRTR